MLLFGYPVYFRGHQVKDDRFTDKLLNGEVIGSFYYEMLSRRTYREYTQPEPAKKALEHATAYLSQLKEGGLERWSSNYDIWERIIAPTISVLQRPRALVEDVVTGTCFSLEFCGFNLEAAGGEERTYHRGRPTFTTYVYRCLASLNIVWADIAPSMLAVARSINSVYRGIKHADREPPEPEEAFLVSRVTTLAVRLLVTRMVTDSDDSVRDFALSHRFAEIAEQFRNVGLRISEDGSFTKSRAE
jgi:hypothetical protein